MVAGGLWGVCARPECHNEGRDNREKKNPFVKLCERRAVITAVSRGVRIDVTPGSTDVWVKSVALQSHYIKRERVSSSPRSDPPQSHERDLSFSSKYPFKVQLSGFSPPLIGLLYLIQLITWLNALEVWDLTSCWRDFRKSFKWAALHYVS